MISQYPLNELIEISDDDYFSAPGLNQSGIKDLMQSPRHYYARNIEGKKKDPTPAQKFGKIVHLAILQTELFLERAVYEPKFDKRTIVGKEDYKQWLDNIAPNAIRIDIEYKEHLEKMIECWRQHPLSKILSKSCLFERAIFWIDEETGVLCKAKLDAITTKPNEHRGIIIPVGLVGDLKTTTDARADSFLDSIFNYEYDIQAAWYLEAIEKSKLGMGESYLWFALEKDSPYEMEVHTMETLYLANARELNRLMRIRYKQCLEKNEWPGYKKTVKSLHFKSWQLEERKGSVDYLTREMELV